MTGTFSMEWPKEERKTESFRTLRQIEIDETVATLNSECITQEYANMPRYMWDDAAKTVEYIENSLLVTNEHDRLVMTARAAHRTMRMMVRSAMIALGIAHHYTDNTQSLFDKVSEKTGWQPVSDIELLSLCHYDGRKIDFIPEHDPEITAKQALQDAQNLTEIIRTQLVEYPQYRHETRYFE